MEDVSMVGMPSMTKDDDDDNSTTLLGIFFLFLVAPTLLFPPLPSPPTPVVLRCRFCCPLFGFDVISEEGTQSFSATPSDDDDSNDNDDDDDDFCTETKCFFCTDDCAD